MDDEIVRIEDTFAFMVIVLEYDINKYELPSPNELKDFFKQYDLELIFLNERSKYYFDCDGRRIFPEDLKAYVRDEHYNGVICDLIEIENSNLDRLKTNFILKGETEIDLTVFMEISIEFRNYLIYGNKFKLDRIHSISTFSEYDYKIVH